MYQSHDEQMRGALTPLITAILDDPESEAMTDSEIVKLIEIEGTFADFFKLRGTAATCLGWDVPSRERLLAKVQRQRLLRLFRKMLEQVKDLQRSREELAEKLRIRLAVKGKLPPHLRGAVVDETELARYFASQPDLRKADDAEEKLECPRCCHRIVAPEDFGGDEIECELCGAMMAVKAAKERLHELD